MVKISKHFNLQLLSIPNAIFDMTSVEYNATVSLMFASDVFENLTTKLSVITDMISNINFIFPELNVGVIFIRFGFQSSTFMVSCNPIINLLTKKQGSKHVYKLLKNCLLSCDSMDLRSYLSTFHDQKNTENL